jgi:uncharacterized protein (DUF1778 family)
VPRRRKAKSERKEAMIYIRVTTDQKQMLEDAASRLSLDVSSWVRSLSIREARRLAAEERKHG